MSARCKPPTRSAAALLHQARLASDTELRLGVAKRMYQMRFQEEPDPALTLEQLRGWEGKRVRDAYAKASAETASAIRGLISGFGAIRRSYPAGAGGARTRPIRNPKFATWKIRRRPRSPSTTGLVTVIF